MIELNTPTGLVKIHDQWSELTQAEYVGVCGVIAQIQAGELSFFDARLKLLEVLTGYKRSKKRYSADDQQQINDNLSILAGMIRFVFKPEYTNTEILDVLTPDLRTLLHSQFPFEISDSQHVQQLKTVGELLKYRIAINLDVQRNYIPELTYPTGTFYGPLWQVDENNILTTDILADEYIDALDYYKLYHQTQNPIYLQGLAAALYRPNRKKYDSVEVQKNAYQTPSQPEVLLGIYYFFQGIQEYLVNKSAWHILFAKANSPTPDSYRGTANSKISLGMVEHLYSLSKEGYGSREQLGLLNLKDMLNLMFKQLQDTVGTLRSYKLKDYQIAQKLQLSIEIIQQL
jgi:hypothetical protein